MAEFREYIVSTLLIGLFVFALIAFGVQLATENNVNNSILNNEAVNRSYVNIQEELNATSAVAESQQTGFFKDIPIIGEISLILKSIAGVTRVFFNVLVNFYNLFMTLIAETIGIPSIILNGIFSIILLSMILLAWKVYRMGS